MGTKQSFSIFSHWPLKSQMFSYDSVILYYLSDEATKYVPIQYEATQNVPGEVYLVVGTAERVTGGQSLSVSQGYVKGWERRLQTTCPWVYLYSKSNVGIW